MSCISISTAGLRQGLKHIYGKVCKGDENCRRLLCGSEECIVASESLGHVCSHNRIGVWGLAHHEGDRSNFIHFASVKRAPISVKSKLLKFYLNACALQTCALKCLCSVFCLLV
jgi:hypothetical protein